MPNGHIGIMPIEDIIEREVKHRLDVETAHRDAMHALVILSNYADRRKRLVQKIGFIDGEEPRYDAWIHEKKTELEYVQKHFPWKTLVVMLITTILTSLIIGVILGYDFFTYGMVIAISFVIVGIYSLCKWVSEEDKAKAELERAKNALDEIHEERNEYEAEIIEMESENVYKLFENADPDLSWLTYNPEAIEWCIYTMLHNDQYRKASLPEIIAAWNGVHNESST